MVLLTEQMWLFWNHLFKIRKPWILNIELYTQLTQYSVKDLIASLDPCCLRALLSCCVVCCAVKKQSSWSLLLRTSSPWWLLLPDRRCKTCPNKESPVTFISRKMIQSHLIALSNVKHFLIALVGALYLTMRHLHYKSDYPDILVSTALVWIFTEHSGISLRNDQTLLCLISCTGLNRRQKW